MSKLEDAAMTREASVRNRPIGIWEKGDKPRSHDYRGGKQRKPDGIKCFLCTPICVTVSGRESRKMNWYVVLFGQVNTRVQDYPSRIASNTYDQGRTFSHGKMT